MFVRRRRRILLLVGLLLAQSFVGWYWFLRAAHGYRPVRALLESWKAGDVEAMRILFAPSCEVYDGASGGYRWSPATASSVVQWVGAPSPGDKAPDLWVFLDPLDPFSLYVHVDWGGLGTCMVRLRWHGPTWKIDGILGWN